MAKKATLITPNTQYRLRSKSSHKNFIVNTTEKSGNLWRISSQQIIEFSSDFTNEEHNKDDNRYYYSIKEDTLWRYRIEYIKWHGGDPSTEPGPIEG